MDQIPIRNQELTPLSSRDGARDLAGILSAFSRIRVVALAGWMVLASACASAPSANPHGRIMLVDGLGAPVQGAVVLPEEGDLKTTRQTNWSKDEIAARVSDSQGMVRADLEQYYWDSDGCYHFRVLRTGFEDFAMTVSKDLFPSVLKVNLEPESQRTKN
jgi:hypothetical protein